MDHPQLKPADLRQSSDAQISDFVSRRKSPRNSRMSADDSGASSRLSDASVNTPDESERRRSTGTDEEDALAFESFHVRRQSVVQQALSIHHLERLESEDERESSSFSVEMEDVGGGITPSPQNVGGAETEWPEDLTDFQSSERVGSEAAANSGKVSVLSRKKRKQAPRRSGAFPNPQLVQRKPHFERKRCPIDGVVGAQTEWTEDLTDIQSSDHAASGPSANPGKILEISRNKPKQTKRKSGGFPRPQFVQRKPFFEEEGGAEIPTTPKGYAPFSPKKVEKVSTPGEKKKIVQTMVVNGMEVPKVSEAPGKINIHIPDVPSAPSKKSGNSLSQKRKEAPGKVKQRNSEPQKKRKKVSATPISKNVKKQKTRDSKKKQEKFPRRSRLKAYQRSNRTEAHLVQHKKGPIDIGIATGFKPLNVDTSDLFYGTTEERLKRLTFERNNKRNLGPVEIGKLKDYTVAQYDRKGSGPGITGYRPWGLFLSSMLPVRKKSRNPGPTDIGWADYDEDSYSLDISSEDFLKPKTLYRPLSRSGACAERAERKKGPVEIGRVSKTEWKPYKMNRTFE